MEKATDCKSVKMRLRDLATSSGYSAPMIKLLRQRDMLPWVDCDKSVSWFFYSTEHCQRLFVMKVLVDCGMRTEAASRIVRGSLSDAVSVATVLARVHHQIFDLASLRRHNLS